MKYILLVLTFLAVSCTAKKTEPDPIKQVGCALESSLTTALSSSIAEALSCTNVSGMQVDLLAALGKANLCAKASDTVVSPQVVKPKGVIGDVICPLAVQSAMGLVSSKIPAGWSCSPTASTATLTAALGAACKKVVGI